MAVVLPFTDIDPDISDLDLPKVSINIPCYCRREFIPLIIMNINCQSYPREKIEVVILQDGPQNLFISPVHESVFREAIHPATLIYKYQAGRATIGHKRNQLVKMSSNKIIASMDSDDIYLPSYLRYSVNALLKENAGATSSAAMLFVYPKLDYKLTHIWCARINQCHEACAVFTKKYHAAVGGFEKISQGEGISFFGNNEKKVINLDIEKLMVCVCHGDNTIGKSQFLKSTDAGRASEESPHIRLLKEMF
jgi:cellulose synthase/poly-beta-1,6-N-acetylglucosamine synthase-like glycosyltransferase